MQYSLFKVERCLREGETCNIASAGYDSTVCRWIEVFKFNADFADSVQDLTDNESICKPNLHYLHTYLKMKMEM